MEGDGNGHSRDLPRSVSIRKDGKIDYDSIQSILESFKDVLKGVSDDVKDIKVEQVAMKKDMKPVISFYRKVLTIVVFLSAMFTAYKTGIADWIKDHLSK